MDSRVLSADYLPNRLVHREGEREEIARNLRPLLEDGFPNDMLLYGSPGTGKTAMARFVVEELEERADVNLCYVNCFSQKSKFEVFYKLLDQRLKVPRDGTSTEKVLDLFEEKTREKPTVIIVDEVDQVRDDETLYELSRFSNCGKIFIANDETVFSDFEKRVRSRLSGMQRIRFGKYSVDELTDILALRKEHGLKESSISRKQLERIASQSSGDARIALNTLRFAARTSENRGKEKITDDVIDEAIGNTYDSQRSNALERLNQHQRTVYSILDEKGEMQIGELYDRYSTRVDDGKSRRTLLRYLKKMVSYEVLEKTGEKSSTVYSVEE